VTCPLSSCLVSLSLELAPKLAASWASSASQRVFLDIVKKFCCCCSNCAKCRPLVMHSIMRDDGA
jgi:hypothetical protein